MKEIHLICNAHIDPVWQWNWQEAVGVTLATFATAADLCEEYPAFVFNHNEALLYEWVEQHDPILFERIRRLVREKNGTLWEDGIFSRTVISRQESL